MLVDVLVDVHGIHLNSGRRIDGWGGLDGQMDGWIFIEQNQSLQL